MEFEMTNEQRILSVFHLDHLTSELVGEGQVQIAPMTGLPAHCTLVKPPREKKNTARVFNVGSGAWDYVEDNRGKTVYDKTTSFPYLISALGPLAENFTTIAPGNPYSKWTGSGWKTDEAAAEQGEKLQNIKLKETLFDQASRKMAPLQSAVKLEMATDVEKQQLILWEKYIVLLNRVDVTKPEWPAVPEDVA